MRLDSGVEALETILNLLNNSGVPAVLVGELVLNYYNVPCVLHVRLPRRNLSCLFIG